MSGRNEVILGLIGPLLVLVALAVLAVSTEQPGVCIAFMAAVPMFAAMFTGAAFTGIVAAAAVLTGGVCAAATYGQQFADAIPVLIGLIVGAAAAVIASQAKAAAPPRRVLVPPPAAEQGAAPSTPDDEPDTDELTGLPRRRAALRSLAGPNAAGARVVAFLDCDGLAAFNDRHGRDIGDVLLFAVAGRTRYALPEEDTVARWDGGQFLLVISGDPASVAPTLELVADKVNKNPIRTDSGLVPATVSVGAAPWVEGDEFDDAVARARRALYTAKCQGPGHLVMESADPA